MGDFTVELNTGPKHRRQSIVRVPVKKELLAQGSSLVLTCQESGHTLCGQLDAEEGELVFIIPDAPAGKTGKLKVSPAAAVAPRAKATRRAAQVDVSIDGAPFTEYHVSGPGVPKPYMAPLIGPYGDDVARPVAPEIKEHPHHRGIFIAHGDVCGEEIWNEPPDKHGRTDQNTISIAQGDVFAKLLATLTWKDRAGKALMDETRSCWIYATPREARVIDLKLEFSAAYSDVTLGPTKEAGFLGIRVHPDINGNAGKGGLMENSYGAVGEAQCWSKKAHWCDYHGIVNGNRVGIAAFDHPANLRFPTRWHIRDYGLFAANCWFWDGPHTIPKGERLTFRYRIIIHAGDTRAAGIAERFVDYDVPAAGKVAEQ